MSARSIALGWEIPAYTVDCAFAQGEAVTLAFTKATTTDVSTWTIVGYLKKYNDTATVVPLRASGLTSAGAFSLALTAAQTLALALQTYYLEVWRTDTGSETLL